MYISSNTVYVLHPSAEYPAMQVLWFQFQRKGLENNEEKFRHSILIRKWKKNNMVQHCSIVSLMCKVFIPGLGQDFILFYFNYSFNFRKRSTFSAKKTIKKSQTTSFLMHKSLLRGWILLCNILVHVLSSAGAVQVLNTSGDVQSLEARLFSYYCLK